jgi:ATP/maltotriose-dependent transcriptional regulator MalT
MSLLPRWLLKLFQKQTDEEDRQFTSTVSVPELSIEEAEPEQIVEFDEREEDQEGEEPTPYEFEIFPEDPEVRRKWFSLTIRERQVVALVCMGHRNYDIASMLNVEYTTIQTHLQHIFYKFDLRSRKEIREALKSWQAEKWWYVHHN